MRKSQNTTTAGIDNIGQGLHVLYLGSDDPRQRRTELLSDLTLSSCDLRFVAAFEGDPGPVDEEGKTGIDFDAALAGIHLAIVDIPGRADCEDNEDHGYQTVTVPFICDQDLFKYEAIATELDKRGIPYGTCFDAVFGPCVNLIDRDGLVRLLARARQTQPA
jgi:hypothetical protein